MRFYENGLIIGKDSLAYNEIKSAELKQIKKDKQEGEIIKTDGQKLTISGSLFNAGQIVKNLQRKI